MCLPWNIGIHFFMHQIHTVSYGVELRSDNISHSYQLYKCSNKKLLNFHANESSRQGILLRLISVELSGTTSFWIWYFALACIEYDVTIPLISLNIKVIYLQGLFSQNVFIHALCNSSKNIKFRFCQCLRVLIYIHTNITCFKCNQYASSE